MRLPDEDYEALQAMSLLTGRSMADLVRDAVADSLTYFASSNELYQSFKEELRARELAMETLKQRLPADQRGALDAPGDEAAEAAAGTGRRPSASARREQAASPSRR
jgi:hypothetical protein